MSGGSSIIITTKLERVIIQNSGVPGATGSSGGGGTVFNHQVTSGEIASGSLTLPSTPGNPGSVAVFIVGGCAQIYGIDYTISGNTLSWSGLGMATIISTNDYVTIEY